jgi:hypothetical protein
VTRPTSDLIRRSLWGVVGLALLGCEAKIGGSGATGSNPDGELPEIPGVTTTTLCYTPEQSFEWELYGPVFSRCIGCHNDFGLARLEGVALRLTFPGEPGFAEKNVAVLSPYASGLIVAKPTAQIAHVGGQVIQPGSAEARLLESFAAKLRNPPACAETPGDAAAWALASLELAAPRATYARAKFILTGELATPEELDALPDTEEMLDAKLDELMSGEGFLVRTQEMFGDWLRTDAYSTLVRGNQLLNQLRDYPRNSYYLPLCTPEDMNGCCDAATEDCCGALAPDPASCTEQAEDAAIDAVAREPLELVKHVVKNELPLTELLTANYGMVNPYSAVIYGFTDAQRAQLFDADPSNDTTEFRALPITPTSLNSLRAGPSGNYPHSGVLTMPSTLIRYPSSTSNQERTRAARLLLERMLAIPVMKLADFNTNVLPADADLELATQTYPACTACHAAIDPIAAHFRNFGSAGQYRPSSDGSRFGQLALPHLPPPSFLGTEQAEADTTDPVRWLAAQVAAHHRFPIGVLLPVLADLIGAEILTPPTDVLSEKYAEKYLAFRIQQLEIQRLRREFGGPAGLRLKPLVKAIVKGSFFRAIGASAELDALSREALSIAGVGPGTLLTPEQMARKIESATGHTYRRQRSPEGRDLFRSFQDYRLMFGGTDWDATPERYREPNAMSVRIALRMGNEMACVAVPQDLAIKDKASRKLFPNVDVATTAASGEAAIRTEIRRLHRLLLNEDLPEGDAELQATYQLWLAAYRAAEGDDSRGRCDATESFAPEATPYPTDTHDLVEDGPAVRAWVAVLAYLFADGRFFLQ